MSYLQLNHYLKYVGKSTLLFDFVTMLCNSTPDFIQSIHIQVYTFTYIHLYGVGFTIVQLYIAIKLVFLI